MYCMGRNIRGSTLLVLFLAVIREISAFSNTLWHFVCRNPPFFHNRTSHSDDNGVTGTWPLQGGLRLFPAKPLPAPNIFLFFGGSLCLFPLLFVSA